MLMRSAPDSPDVMTRPPHTHNPAYRPRQTLFGALVTVALSLVVVSLLAAPLATLLSLTAIALAATGLRTVLADRRRTGRRRTVCLPLLRICVRA